MKNLKIIRKENGFSQKKIASAINISQQSYSDYENNKTFPDAETLIKIADFFAVSVDYLLGRTDDLGYITISNAPAFELTEHEKNVISLYRKLKPHTQSYVYGIMQNMVISG